MKVFKLFFSISSTFAFAFGANWLNELNENEDSSEMTNWISERSKLKNLQKMMTKLNMLKMTIELPEEVQRERQKQAAFV